MGRLTWAWPSTWTWAMPMALRWQVTARDGVKRNGYRRRLYDYAMAPDPTLPAEVLRRGFLEGA